MRHLSFLLTSSLKIANCPCHKGYLRAWPGLHCHWLWDKNTNYRLELEIFTEPWKSPSRAQNRSYWHSLLGERRTILFLFLLETSKQRQHMALIASHMLTLPCTQTWRDFTTSALSWCMFLDRELEPVPRLQPSCSQLHVRWIAESKITWFLTHAHICNRLVMKMTKCGRLHS